VKAIGGVIASLVDASGLPGQIEVVRSWGPARPGQRLELRDGVYWLSGDGDLWCLPSVVRRGLGFCFRAARCTHPAEEVAHAVR
jgi:hypothetical protein